MKLLLDTHIFLWATADPQQLGPRTRDSIEDSNNEIYISSVVSWEIGIKHSRGRLLLPMPPSLFVSSRISHYGFKRLPITIEHTLAATSLPRIHDDPFDRMLVGQAQIEDMTLVSVDAQIAAYGVNVLAT